MSAALSIVIGVVVGSLTATASLALTRFRAELVARGRPGLATLLHWVGLALIAAALLLLQPLGRESFWAGAAALVISRASLLFVLRRSEAALATPPTHPSDPERRR